MVKHLTRACLLASAIVAATVVAQSGARAATKFDGAWSVEFFTRAGPCDRSYHYNGVITNGYVNFPGAGTVTGRVSASGHVTVAVSVGQSHGAGSGHMTVNAGSGSWRGAFVNGTCSGVWSARRG
jgi:hypothetical protein